MKTTENKKQTIEDLTKGIISFNTDNNEITQLIKKAVNSGALDIEGWEPDQNPMILPKIIAIAILENIAEGLKGKGTSFEKQVKKEVKNLKCFI